MSRSCYTDDYGDDHPGILNLFRANVRRSIQSRAGQARLCELRAALLALPVKALEADIFAEGSNDVPRVCALGAWALAHADGNVQQAHALVPRDADDHETHAGLKAYGWPRLVVLETVYQNDDGDVWRAETPEQRYARVLRWVEREIVVRRNDNGAADEAKGATD